MHAHRVVVNIKNKYGDEEKSLFSSRFSVKVDRKENSYGFGGDKNNHIEIVFK